ncbi:TPA: hypothetical protein HA241_02025 [Candidatus Woesearchaeota archaeon]|nr:hypothetical protein [Candidatus Woesearchaeota archaeon]
MAAPTEQKKVSRIKEKKKLWYRILAPALFAQKELGESYLDTPLSAMGRTLKVNLKDLTGNMKDQNVYVKFRIVAVEGQTLRTKTLGFEYTVMHIKRLARKNVDRLDDTFTFTTKEGLSVIVKTLLVTLHKTQRSLQAKLRGILHQDLEEEFAKSDFDTFVSNLVSQRTIGSIRKKLTKLYPLKDVIVRVVLLKDQQETNTPVQAQEQPLKEVQSA